MGIKQLLKQLPGGTETHIGFEKLLRLLGLELDDVDADLMSVDSDSNNDEKIKFDIDTGTLLFVCAIRNRQACLAGDYT